MQDAKFRVVDEWNPDLWEKRLGSTVTWVYNPGI